MKKFFAVFLATLFVAGFCFSQATINVNGFVQMQYVNTQGDVNAVNPITGVKPAPGISNFAINRARLNLLGDVAENVSYRIQLENADLAYPNASDDRDLVDAYVDLKYIQGMTIRIGQFVQPVGTELVLSPYVLETINYSSIVGATAAALPLNPAAIPAITPLVTYSTRERGIMAFGTPVENLSYQLAVVNGNRENVNDVNRLKDWVGKVKWQVIPELSLALSHYAGKYMIPTAFITNTDKKRTGGEINLKIDNLRICGEYLSAKDGIVKSSAYYGHISYKIPETLWQLVARYDVRDPNTNAINDKTKTTTLGVNYDFEKNARLQINYVIPQEAKGARIDNNSLIVQLGVKF